MNYEGLNNYVDIFGPRSPISPTHSQKRRKRGTKRRGAKRSKPKISKWNSVKSRLSNIKDLQGNNNIYVIKPIKLIIISYLFFFMELIKLNF